MTRVEGRPGLAVNQSGGGGARDTTALELGDTHGNHLRLNLSFWNRPQPAQAAIRHAVRRSDATTNARAERHLTDPRVGRLWT